MTPAGPGNAGASEYENPLSDTLASLLADVETCCVILAVMLTHYTGCMVINEGLRSFHIADADISVALRVFSDIADR